MANSLGDWITSPWANLAFTFLGANEQDRATDESNAANKALEDEIRQYYSDLRKRVLAGDKTAEAQERRFLASMTKNNRQRLLDQNENLNQATARRERDELAYLDRELPDLLREQGEGNAAQLAFLDSVRSDSATGHADRLKYLEGAGEQERKDIARRSDENLSAANQDLVSRGLTGSTALSGTRALYEREKGDELGRLEERLRQQRLNVSGEALSASERLGMARADTMNRLASDYTGQRARNIGARSTASTSLSADRINQLSRGYDQLSAFDDTALIRRLGQLGNNRANRSDLDLRMAESELAFLQGINHMPPQSNAYLNYANQLGRNSVETPKQPSFWDRFAGPAVGAAGRIGAAAMLAPYTGGMSMGLAFP